MDPKLRQIFLKSILLIFLYLGTMFGSIRRNVSIVSRVKRLFPVRKSVITWLIALIYQMNAFANKQSLKYVITSQCHIKTWKSEYGKIMKQPFFYAFFSLFTFIRFAIASLQKDFPTVTVVKHYKKLIDLFELANSLFAVVERLKRNAKCQVCVICLLKLFSFIPNHSSHT